MKVKVLSLFDGMACGMLAFQKVGIAVDNYYAYEIDKYAIQTATHNFPQIQECGDVFNADFSKYHGIDYLVGGSPCTFWSIAQSPDKRETTASGIGWELFSQYVRALREAKPKYFIYENNKSMANAIKQAISETFGFEPICINSALVSAQNRQRLYWVGKRNADGTYSKVEVEQPEDRGILLRDVLDGYEPVNTTTDGKSKCLRATCYTDGIRNIAGNIIDRKTGVAEPVLKVREATRKGHIEVNCGELFDYEQPNSKTRRGRKMCEKSNCLTTSCNFYQYIAYAVEFNENGEPTKAVSKADGKTYTVYEVKDGNITIKGKTYPIKLIDGYYIIRKLTVSECKRLQTVPEWYEFPVSDTQAYKMLGNGWTCNVITHLINSTRE